MLDFFGLQNLYTIEPLPGGYKRLQHKQVPEIALIYQKPEELREILRYFVFTYRSRAFPSFLPPINIIRLGLALCRIELPEEKTHFETPDKKIVVKPDLFVLESPPIQTNLILCRVGKNSETIQAHSFDSALPIRFIYNRVHEEYENWLNETYGEGDYSNLWTHPKSKDFLDTSFVALPLPLRPASTLRDEDYQHPMFAHLDDFEWHRLRSMGDTMVVKALQ